MNLNQECRMPELLYLGKGQVPSGQIHKHAFYQIEYCISGKLTCKTEKEQFVLTPEEYWLISPEKLHEFVENDQPFEYMSLKFNSPIVSQTIHGHDLIISSLLEQISNLIDSNEFSPYSAEGKYTIESLIYGIQCKLAQKNAIESQDSLFRSTVREAVYKFGYKINVSELAQLFKCSRSQFYYLFLNEFGPQLSPKHYIEQIIINIAQKHLKYSAMSISEIAREMNFPSVYVFSRFFKRLTGSSPSMERNSRSSD